MKTFSTPEVAKLTGIPYHIVWGLCDDGTLKSFTLRNGGRKYIQPMDLHDFLLVRGVPVPIEVLEACKTDSAK